MGSCTFGLVFSNLLPFFIACPNQLFRNSFHFYRYNLFLCLLEPVIECRVWNIVANAERVDGNSIGLTLGFVEEPQSFKIFFAKHNLSSFKFSTKVCERDMLVNTPILEAYVNTPILEVYRTFFNTFNILYNRWKLHLNLRHNVIYGKP